MSSRFHSSLAKDLQAFLRYKRAMGFRYERQEETLLSFDRHLQKKKDIRRLSFESLIQSWLERSTPRKAISVAGDLQVIRQFCLFRRRKEPRAFVPPADWAPPVRKSHFVPHIFTPSEIKQMVKCCSQLSPWPQYNRGIRMLLLVLYCTGMRFGEAARLRLADLDMDRRVIWVRHSKGRTRLVPFRRDLARELVQYLKNRASEMRSPETPLFLNRHGRAHSTKTISYGLLSLIRKIGLKKKRGRVGPRPYDLRHTFAVHRLTRWYRQGVALSERLPWLSIYMGHADILGTESYLTTTPELMRLTATRFRARFDRKRRF
jgi:integrase